MITFDWTRREAEEVKRLLAMKVWRVKKTLDKNPNYNEHLQNQLELLEGLLRDVKSKLEDA